MNRASVLGLLLCASLGGCFQRLEEPVAGGTAPAISADADQVAPAGEGRRRGRRGRRDQAVQVAPTRLTTIGVNAYLWRAALDTVSFMSIAQTDSNGGVIVTEWYVSRSLPNERMKVSITILDQDLRADAVRVAAARQVLQNGQWVDAAVQAATNQRLEEIILQKARDLRRNAVAG